MTRTGGLSLDVVLLAVHAQRFEVLARRSAPGAREKWQLPWRDLDPDVAPDDGARTVARDAMRSPLRWLEQVGLVSDGRRHPSGSSASLGFAGLLPWRDVSADQSLAWLRADAPDQLAPRQRGLVDRALEHLRDRMDGTPVAFRLLPDAFTLGELQDVYELLLERRLHKASFRRALMAAHLVEPLEEWRGNRRGRPAQYYRFSPRRGRAARRVVRFDLLG